MTRTIRTHVGQVMVAAALMAFAAAPAAQAQLAVQHDSTGVTETAGNGNGVPEPGDTLALTENVMSVDPDQTFTGVSGTLGTAAANVTVGSAQSAYADLAFAVATPNATPFSVSLSSAMECGAAVPFTLSLQTSAGPTDVAFTLPTGGTGAFAGHESADVPRAIPDGDTMMSDLTIAGTGGRAKNVRVRIGHITHSFDGDLTLSLVAPDGRTVKLVGAKGGAGQDFVDTVFDDSASGPIKSSTLAPFTGTFKPAQPLSAMDGAPLAGTWKLKITDGALGNVGTIDAWGADIAPAVCAPQAPPPPPPPPPPPDPQPRDCGLHNGHGHAYGLFKHGRGHDRDCPDHDEHHGHGGKHR